MHQHLGERFNPAMTQHNAALVEEINAAIEQTETQARELDRIVEVFMVEKVPAKRSATDLVPDRAQRAQAGARSYRTCG